MANIKSAKKRILQIERNRLRNQTLRSRAYTFIKKARKALTGASLEEAKIAVHEAFSAIDRMVPKGIFKRNKADRLKSRLHQQLKVKS